MQTTEYRARHDAYLAALMRAVDVRMAELTAKVTA